MPTEQLTTLRRIDTPTVRISLMSKTKKEVNPDDLPDWLVRQLDTLERFLRQVAPYLGTTDDDEVRTFSSPQAIQPCSNYNGFITLRDPDSDFPKSEAEVHVDVELPYEYHDSFVPLVFSVCKMAQDHVGGTFGFVGFVVSQIHRYGK
ncbi:MAG TPA: hypothetical protein VK694_03170 [Verrucomicrobiae bacterium]|nr:hypothetical protein [Verrucomicrobiae bacterium]